MYMALLYAAMAKVRCLGNSSGMSEKQMGFWVDCAAAKPMRSASSSLKLVTCTGALFKRNAEPGFQHVALV